MSNIQNENLATNNNNNEIDDKNQKLKIWKKLKMNWK